MPQPDYAADVFPRSDGSTLRLASFNVENLFSRPIAMDYEDNDEGQPFLDAFHELNSLFAKAEYSDKDKDRILELMEAQRLTGSRPRNRHLEFHKLRGTLIAKRDGSQRVVADGRSDWLGWIALKKKAVNDRAILNTARVLAAVDADILMLVEVEDRAGLSKFHDSILLPILRSTGRPGYDYQMVIEGNDERGIDVGLLSRRPIADIGTHVFERGANGSPVFSRDCAEYYLEVPGVPGYLLLLVNHFTSKGSDPNGLRRRQPQASRVREIVAERLSQGFRHLVVAGDLNDTPESQSLAPLISAGTVTDVVSHFADRIDPSGDRLGTYATGREQLDYLMLSAPLLESACGAGIERRGSYAPRSFDRFDSVNGKRDQASDHHCVWVDLRL